MMYLPLHRGLWFRVQNSSISMLGCILQNATGAVGHPGISDLLHWLFSIVIVNGSVGTGTCLITDLRKYHKYCTVNSKYSCRNVILHGFFGFFYQVFYHGH